MFLNHRAEDTFLLHLMSSAAASVAAVVVVVVLMSHIAVRAVAKSGSPYFVLYLDENLMQVALDIFDKTSKYPYLCGAPASLCGCAITMRTRAYGYFYK